MITNEPEDIQMDLETCEAIESHELAKSMGEVVIGKDPAIALGALGLLTVGTIKTCWTSGTGAAITKAYLERLRKELL